jgi:hypothetical protein
VAKHHSDRDSPDAHGTHEQAEKGADVSPSRNGEDLGHEGQRRQSCCRSETTHQQARAPALSSGQIEIGEGEGEEEAERDAHAGHVIGVQRVAVYFGGNLYFGCDPEGEGGHHQNEPGAELHETLGHHAPQVRGDEHPHPADGELGEEYEQGEGKGVNVHKRLFLW